MPRTVARRGVATRARPAPEPSPQRGLPPRASVLDEALGAKVGQKLADLALDRFAVAVELRLDPIGEVGFGGTGLDLADDRGGRRIEGEDLLRARLEQDTAELFGSEFHVLGELHPEILASIDITAQSAP